jgi:hypothetical protein
MVYAADSKSAARKGLRVQVSSPALGGIVGESPGSMLPIDSATAGASVLSVSYQFRNGRFARRSVIQREVRQPFDGASGRAVRWCVGRRPRA